MLSKADLQHLIPHHDKMFLLDAVLGWDTKQIRCISDSHRSPDHPLRSAEGLRAVHLCEYGAQAMAIHGGLLAQATNTAPQPGLLVSLRAIRFYVSRIDDLPESLIIRAEKLSANSSTWQYAFQIEHAQKMLAQGQAMVLLST